MDQLTLIEYFHWKTLWRALRRLKEVLHLKYIVDQMADVKGYVFMHHVMMAGFGEIGRRKRKICPSSWFKKD
ncbi:hypothetical protein RchiOBHm_Chr1g0322351 [Rosa chinensis]|uniref:Uncharacterized protein n=1 Tax=Rosa chinensis TaxID=74649 RepID=A0A2P6S9A4_ROSCH|nr:hypothetical protein RchiOBHm_Chr1g0322351 [Rosa chinensis]